MEDIIKKGHLDRHITSKTKLRRRLYGCNMDAVSSYFTYDIAQKTINSTIQKNQQKINKWRNQNEKKLVIYDKSQKALGFGYFRENENVIFCEDLKKFCIVLEKESEKSHDYRIVTSYLLR